MQEIGIQQPFIWPYEYPPKFKTYWFEKFDHVRGRNWMEKNWTISLYICVIYYLLIYLGTRYMRYRKPYELKVPLAIWDFGFTLFSLVGLIRCLPELSFVLKGENVFYRLICVRGYHGETEAFWAWIFVFSKVFELGDTAFIVLRKQQLLFLHYYHHSITLVTCWYFYPYYEPVSRPLLICNLLVHFILYGYFFLKAIHVKMPKVLSKCIILSELLQMILGVIINLYAIWIKVIGQPCEHKTEGIIWQLLLYLSFVVLVVQLFKSTSTPKIKRRHSLFKHD